MGRGRVGGHGGFGTLADDAVEGFTDLLAGDISEGGKYALADEEVEFFDPRVSQTTVPKDEKALETVGDAEKGYIAAVKGD
jgi:hypothetical protein